jgi:hypothetical protein
MADLLPTRRSLHAIAEQVMAGPTHRTSGTIRLRVTADGFATVGEPQVELTATHVLGEAGRFPIDGATCADLAAALGVDGGPPRDLYKDLSGVDPDEVLTVDEAAAREMLAALRAGDAALRRLAPAQTPVLWPEHFDVGITLGEVNYGVSPGDGYCPEPYAYVAPWTPRTGEFWNAPFGSARPLRELPGDALGAYFAEGQDRSR